MQGEIISVKENYASVRVYKKRRDALVPTALTVNASCEGNLSSGELVSLYMPRARFFLLSAFSYLLPFFLAFLAIIITRHFTQSILITEAALIISLIVSYVLSLLLSVFKKPLCTIKRV
jgi:positive regulator of sigma E activity